MTGLQDYHPCEWVLTPSPQPVMAPDRPLGGPLAVNRTDSKRSAGRSVMDSLTFDVTDLVLVMTDYLGALKHFEATINQLNVFPVPDGDTGTNMRSTIESVVGALLATKNDSTPMTLEEIAR